ncbi:T9SS type A sorting domain-containing protein [Neolewinella aurantiaca]|uniref:T9SS type A sorting domain-containing protein n=1 Tax=Neolewinella aurantiaca TaxID=2602767 RepID=A0A5C7FEC0_9BACT|nr:T9SS type A sorting domain-containing protein [Neolewinella aurantiaca]TXF87886.1 T9SS type A sorting domain-containing protein [Neolewinella aurantiaca]
MTYFSSLAMPLGRLYVTVFSLFLLSGTLFAEGTANLRTADGDPVMLFVGHPDFGDFASYDGPANSRLLFRIAEAGETVYIGMSHLFKSSGIPESFGQFDYRVRSVADGSVVFGPVRVNSNNENLSTFEQAALGPAVFNAGGYPTDDESSFVAPAAGEYYIEFDQNSSNRPRYIGLWDITIANNDVVQTGRVYSRNWAFRVPELDPQVPECAFGAELSTKFYSYTSDGFVTEIDFTDSGFQPLSFNLAFNRTGPGESGDLLADRQSIAGENATANVAEHLIFLEEPDPVLFPDGRCGSVSVSGTLMCQPDETFCIPVTASLPGQVQLLLDFDGNGVYDIDSDRLLAYGFEDSTNLSACVPWDGLLADGSRSPNGATVDIIVSYIQGVQHWALYDGELMRNGFCVTPIRPICNDAGTANLHYDDVNIPDDPGNGAPTRVLDGCECRTDNCRTWTNFEAYPSSDCTVVDENTTGYGDKNTLNTWWFASSQTVTSFDVPIDVASVSGPMIHCPDEEVPVTLIYSSINDISSIRWTGPNGPLVGTNDQETILVSQSGDYSVVVIDEFGCESTNSYMLMDVQCSLNLELLSVSCDDNGTELNQDDDTFTATVRVNGDNSASFTSNGETYAYGVEIEIGPFLIADGNITFTATDETYSCCTESIEIDAPMPCSNGCAITSGEIISTECSDPGTPTDPSDDTFVIVMVLDGVNVGPGWTTERGDSGVYGEEVTFGPYLIADGAQSFQFRDEEDEDCAFTATVQPPMPCSNVCILEPVVSNAVCDDNDTPFDITDDTYTFELNVGMVNAPTVAYNVNGDGAYFYDATVTVGPLPLFGADFTFTIADLGGASCSTTFTLAEDERPTGCEAVCSLNITDSRVSCNDFGTEDPEDDEYSVEIFVTTQNTNSNGWELANGQQGRFNEFVRVGSIVPGSGTLTITIQDQDDPTCLSSIAVDAPEIEVTCPEDVNEITHEVTLQSFEGELTTENDFEAAEQEVCWMSEESFSGQRRYYERFTIARTEEDLTELRLFSFYLYAPADNELLGAVFSQRGEETLDCCNLSNDGPVTAEPSGLLSLPVLPDSLIPEGMVLQQRFSVALRPNEVYSLVTSSVLADETGDFRWLIVSADGEELRIRRPEASAPVTELDTIGAIFDLVDNELTGLFNDAGSLNRFGVPQIDSFCGAFDIVFSDDSLGTCVSARIVRSFSLSLPDTVLNDVCAQTINFRSLNFEDITWPPVQIRFGCSDEFPVDENNHPAPIYTGYPFVYIGGQPVALNGSAGIDLVTDYSDVETIRPEDGGTTILRTWTVQDPCRSVTTTYLQTIKLENNGLPFFSCPISNHYCPIIEEDIMLWPLEQDDCWASIEVPQPDLNNICDSSGWTFTTEVLSLGSNGDTTLYRTLEMNDDRLIENVPPGDYLLYFTGIHPQEEIEGRYCRIRVADLSDPVMVCKSTINLSLPGSGFIGVPISVINQFSYDNCGIDSLQIRSRLVDTTGWSAWDDNRLYFDCNDVGFELTVQLRGVDAAGNENYCSSTVLITDNTDPYCTGLETLYLNCDSLPDHFNAYDTTLLRELFGMPDVVDNCSARATELMPVLTGDNCSPERIRRRFQAVDQHGNLSMGIFMQDIYITPSLSYAIRFPKDAETDCTNFTDTLQIVGSSCDSITSRWVDILLPIEGEECRYVQRNFVITNWCEWDGVSPSIRIERDENCNGIEGEADVWLIRTEDSIYIDTDSLYNNDLPVAEGFCGDNPAGYIRQEAARPGGRYVYSQRFKVFDTIAPVLEITMLDSVCVDTSFCRAPIPATIIVNDACQIDEGQIVVGVDINNNGVIETTSNEVGELTGSFPEYTFATNLPVGIHRYVFTVTDDCGNTVVDEQVFEVYDCYVPALVCRGDRIYNLAPLLEEGDIDNDGIVEEAAVLVEAVDLARCNFADCSGDLTFSLNRVGEKADFSMTSIFLDCDDRYEVYLEVYVWDNAFNPFSVQPDGSIGGRNWRKCEVKVRLQDPNLACNSCQVGESLTLNGHVNSLNGTPITDVEVRTEAGTTVTNGFGGYQLSASVGGSYVLSAAKDIDPREGLSTIDLVILQRHLLGMTTIDNPFLRLAADLNRDGTADIYDLIALRGLILAREELYPEGSLWRFVDANWDGTGTPSEEISIEQLQACGFDHDFIGIRLGDLDDSVGAFAGASTSGRSSVVDAGRPVSLGMENKAFSAGEEVVVTLSLENSTSFAGGQAGLRWNDAALTYLGISSTSLNTEDNFRSGRDYLWMSWANYLTTEEIVSVRFRAQADGQLSDYLAMAEDERLSDEVYGNTLSTHPLFLTWSDAAVTDTAADSAAEVSSVPDNAGLLGVLPNPARSFTRIGVYISEAQRVQITVTDLNGRLLLEASPQLEGGEQWVRVDVQDWPVGAYIFRVQTNDGPLSGRIIRQ